MQSLLTAGQRSLLRVLLALGGFMAANSIYLRFSQPEGQSLPAFFQWMLLAHIYMGLLLLAPMVGFILWHFTVVLRRRHAFAVWTGIGIAAAGVLLAATGLYIRSAANNASNRWVFWVHVVLGLAIPAAYVLHRVSAEQRPTWKRLGGGIGVVLLGAAALAGIHRGTEGPPVPDAAPFSRLRLPPGDPGGDPFVPFTPERTVAEARRDSYFFPSPVTTLPSGAPAGSRVSYAAVTNGDVPTQQEVSAEVAAKGFVADGVIGAATCARCHPDVVAQWKSSAHRFSSFNNPFYRATVLDMRKEDRGFVKSKWCAGCHDPAVLFPGKMDREFDADLPDAQAGLTCLACHAIDAVHGVGGNGAYTFADRTVTQYLFSGIKEGPGVALHDVLLRAKPEVHKRDMLKPWMRTSEFCAACHKVSLQEPVNDYRWFRGQNEYDAWHNSGVARNNPQTFYLPPASRECQDCHMPPEDAPLGDLAAKQGKVRSHRFLGPNTALPAIRGDGDMLERIRKFREGALRVDVFALRRESPDGGPADLRTGLPYRREAVRAGETVEVQVVVRNLNVGHTFPGGTLDSNEGWLAVEVLDPAGRVLLRSGYLDERGHLSGDAHLYDAAIVDRHGRRIDRRNAKDIFVPAQANVIPPGGADVVRYSVTVPPELAGKELTVRAVLRWRKFKRDYTEFAFAGREVPTLPVDDLAAGEARLAVLAAGDPLPAEPAPDASRAADWQRWNDLGIGHFIRDDTVLARRAFTVVDTLQPALPDGPRNLARVRMAEGDYAGALELLREADRRAPGDARVAYWMGVALSKQGQYETALQALDRTLQVFPADRNALGERAQALYQLKRYEESLAAWLQVLQVDPEDRNAHHNRAKIYRLLGREREEAEAEKAFERYRLDENAAKVTRDFLQSHPHRNREAQKVHVHETTPPR